MLLPSTVSTNSAKNSALNRFIRLAFLLLAE
jgi:hypothetical protein